MPAPRFAGPTLGSMNATSLAGNDQSALVRPLGVTVGTNNIALGDLCSHRGFDRAKFGGRRGQAGRCLGRTGLPQRLIDAESLAAAGSVIELHDVD